MHDSRDSKGIWRLHHPGVVKGGRLLLVKAGRRLTVLSVVISLILWLMRR